MTQIMNTMEQKDIKPFKQKIWLSSPTMHGDEQKYVQEAFDTNWVSTVGENLNQLDKDICRQVGCQRHSGPAHGSEAGRHQTGRSGVLLGYDIRCDGQSCGL